MLPRAYREWAASDWAALRRGVSSGRGSVVVKASTLGDEKRLAALAVSKSVGTAIVRNAVKRRLRAILAESLPEAPAGVRILVRALPSAARTPYSVLRQDVRGAMGAALAKVPS